MCLCVRNEHGTAAGLADGNSFDIEGVELPFSVILSEKAIKGEETVITD